MVTIGSMTLRDFEVPQVIRYGGQQRLAVHHTGDGRRIIETLGHDDSEIEFGGTLTGADAASRARLLEALCRSGSAVPLVWDGNRLSVIVQRFSADYRVETWIEYRLGCGVVDAAQPAGAGGEPGSRSQVIADATAVAALDTEVAVRMAAISAAAGVSGAFAFGGPANERLRELVQSAIAAVRADTATPASQAIVLGYLHRMVATTAGGVAP